MKRLIAGFVPVLVLWLIAAPGCDDPTPSPAVGPDEPSSRPAASSVSARASAGRATPDAQAVMTDAGASAEVSAPAPSSATSGQDQKAARVGDTASAASPAPGVAATGGPSTSAAATGRTAAARQPDVELVKPGNEPRRQLRFAAKQGQTETMTMTMHMAMAVTLGPKAAPASKIPPVVMTMNIKVTDLKPNGDMRHEFTFTRTKTQRLPGIDPAVNAKVDRALAKLAGLSGHGIVTNRGFHRDVKIATPPGLDPAMRQLMQGMQQATQHIAAPLPEEPVGVGAQWTYTTPMTEAGVKLTHAATYDLVAMEGNVIECKVKVTQTAPKQQVHSPLGQSVQLLLLQATGSGTKTLRLDRLAPVASDSTVRSKVKMDAGRQQLMTIDTSMQLNITPR